MVDAQRHRNNSNPERDVTPGVGQLREHNEKESADHIKAMYSHFRIPAKVEGPVIKRSCETKISYLNCKSFRSVVRGMYPVSYWFATGSLFAGHELRKSNNTMQASAAHMVGHSRVGRHACAMYPSVMISYVVGTEDRIYLACRISHRMELFDYHVGICSVSGVQQRSDLGVVGARITNSRTTEYWSPPFW